MEFIAATNKGLVRECNQDGLWADGISISNRDAFQMQSHFDISKSLFLVFDGVGGVADGKLAVSCCLNYIKSHKLPANETEIIAWIKAMNENVLQIYNYNAEIVAATTIAGVLIAKNFSYAFNVGDSKVFVVNSGFCEEISKDDTVATIASETAGDNQPCKTPLVQYLGNPNGEIEVHIRSFNSSHKVFICTDGVTDMVGIDDLEEILSLGSNEEKGEMLRKKIECNGADDNYTFIYIDPAEVH
jgi:protein phosphatase